MCIGLIALLAACAALAAPPKLGDNLLVNPGFEAGAEGWGLPQPVWSLEATGGTDDGPCAKIANADPAVYLLAGQHIEVVPGSAYAFRARVRTESVEGSDTGATICMEFHDAAGAYLGGVYPEGVRGTRDWTEISGLCPSVPADAAGASITIYLRKGCTGTAWFDDVEAHLSDRELSFTPRLSYPNYRGTILPGQPRRVEVLLPLRDNLQHPAASLGVLVRISDAEGKRLLEEEYAGIGIAPPERCSLDLAKLPPGEYSLYIRLFEQSSQARLQVESIPVTILPKDAPLPQVWIDELGRTIVEGQPVFPLGCYAAERRIDDLDHLRAAGFNCVMNYGMIGGSLDEMRGYLDAASERGVRVLFSVKDTYEGSSWAQTEFGEWKSGMEVVRGMAETFRDHPAVLAWYLNDEMSGDQIPEIRRRYDLLRSLDPDHPVWQVLWFGQDYPAHLASCDAIGVDNYPILAACNRGEGDRAPLESFGAASRALRDAVRGTHAIWMVPECSSQKYVTPASRPPTWEELRCHAFQAITAGARGLVCYWTPGIREDGEAQWGVLGQLGALLGELEPALLAPDAEAERALACAAPRVAVLTREVEGALVAFAVNPYAEPVEARFAWPAAGGDVTSCLPGEQSRPISVVGGQFEDTIPPFGVRMYTVRDE